MILRFKKNRRANLGKKWNGEVVMLEKLIPRRYRNRFF
jgi:hypothetical protein